MKNQHDEQYNSGNYTLWTKRKQGEALLILLLIITSTGTTDREDCEEICLDFWCYSSNCSSITHELTCTADPEEEENAEYIGINALEEFELSIIAALYSSQKNSSILINASTINK